MPLTFPAHQAIVLPLKMARPRWFSGTALAIGSMAPDFDYFLRLGPPWHLGHTLAGQWTRCLPETILVTWLVTRFMAVPLARHLPGGGRFHLEDYRALAATSWSTGYWLKVIPSGLIGSFSHIIWDSFTHVSGWSARRLGLDHMAIATWHGHTLYAFKALQHGSTLVGSLAAILLLRKIGQDRLLLKWAGASPLPVLEPPTTESRLRFWIPVLLFALLGIALTLIAPRPPGSWLVGHLPSTLLFHEILFLFLGLLTGSVVAGPGRAGERGEQYVSE